MLLHAISHISEALLADDAYDGCKQEAGASLQPCQPCQPAASAPTGEEPHLSAD